MSKKPRIEEYHEPAGGWGAALATGAVPWVETDMAERYAAKADRRESLNQWQKKKN
jgi:hypothetical protein